MTSESTLEERARAFLAENTLDESYRIHFEALPVDLAEVVAALKTAEERKEIEAMFTPENAGRAWEALSPSGKYRLVVTEFEQTGDFTYSRGVVYRREGDGWVELPQDIKRNYSAFPYSWIEGHANGHDYLVGGIDYQGQTVLELDTGRRRDLIPREATLGWAFCWAGHEYHPASQLLIVDGCYWACPYERRLYDFSNPMEGWPLLELLDRHGQRVAIEPDLTLPVIEGDVVRFHETKDGRVGGDRELRAIATFQRQGHQLLLREEWLSEAEQRERQAHREGQERYEAWLRELKAKDPLYLEMKRLSAGLPGEDHIAIGVVHDKWCPFYQNEGERRITRRIVASKQLNVELEWGADKGPVLVSVRNEKGTVDRWFEEHSVASIRAAFDFARTFLPDATQSAGAWPMPAR